MCDILHRENQVNLDPLDLQALLAPKAILVMMDGKEFQVNPGQRANEANQAH